METIKVLIAENSYLIRKGLGSILNQFKDFSLVGEVESASDLQEKLFLCSPDVLVLDYASPGFCPNDISLVRRSFPEVKILAITELQSKITISQAIKYGVTSHLLRSCGEEEIIEAIHSTFGGEKFMCGRIVDLILQEDEGNPKKNVSCDGVRLSEREIQVLQLIAEGLANKHIADKLCISKHTVMTHRKHIMGKLKINNTASLVMYAVRENLLAGVSNN